MSDTFDHEYDAWTMEDFYERDSDLPDKVYKKISIIRETDKAYLVKKDKNDKRCWVAKSCSILNKKRNKITIEDWLAYKLIWKEPFEN